jgi:serine/threonine protein kinase
MIAARPIGLATFRGFTVVCKTLPFSALEGNGSQWQSMFENEARIQMDLWRGKEGHQRIVRIYGICFDPPVMKIVVEYCTRGDLARRIR